MSSTYIKWILVAIALAVGVWVVARPSGKNKPGAGGNDDGANAQPNAGQTNAAQPDADESPEPATQSRPGTDPPPATVRSAPQPIPRTTQPQRAPRVNGDDQAGPPGNGGSTSTSTAGGARLANRDEPIDSSLGLWGDGYAEGVRDRWRELQLRFVDDPHSVADDAQQVVDEAVDALTTSVNARKEELGSWRSGRGDDTEELRAAVARYREFLDRLLRV